MSFEFFVRCCDAVREQQQELEFKHRDISELALVARDSKHSRLKAHSEFKATQQECQRNRQKRETVVANKKKQLLKMESGQPQDSDTSRQIQPSLGSHHSQLRSRVNKQMREKREERYRQLAAIHHRIHDQFGTTEPTAIERIFVERRETSETLHRQIEDLQRDREEMKIQISKLQGAGIPRSVGSRRPEDDRRRSKDY
jgi:hypothetical protein